jgi:hypothetical protein
MPSWGAWRRYFELNAARPLPPVAGAAIGLPAAWRAPIARSLARFQIGETGEGRIVAQVARASFDGIDDDYREAVRLFVREEGRHARILAGLVRVMGGALVARSTNERLFTYARRLFGTRAKLVVLLVAEIVGIAFYGALARRLPDGTLKGALEDILYDEDAHLRFHCAFFRGQIRPPFDAIGRAALCRVLGALTAIAFAAMLREHGRTFRVLGVPVATVRGAAARVLAEAETGLAAGERPAGEDLGHRRDAPLEGPLRELATHDERRDAVDERPRRERHVRLGEPGAQVPADRGVGDRLLQHGEAGPRSLGELG